MLVDPEASHSKERSGPVSQTVGKSLDGRCLVSTGKTEATELLTPELDFLILLVAINCQIVERGSVLVEGNEQGTSL